MSASGAAGEERGFALLWWTRRRAVVLDGALGLLSAVECGAQGAEFGSRTGVPVPLAAVLGALAGLALIARRRSPVAVVLVAIAVLPAQAGFVLGLVGLYTLATSAAPRRVIGALACMEGVGTVIVTYVALEQSDSPYEQQVSSWFVPAASVIFGVASVAPPVLLGLYVRARRRLVESLRERADGLERELALLADRAEERAEWARAQERSRIAREMHDVVAHRVSLMVVHAAALQAVARKDAAKAAENAALIGDTGRQALTELRTMLGVLRDSGPPPPEPDDGRAGGNGAGPSLRGLPALVEQSRAAGMPVALTVEGEPRGYDAQVESTAYRLVQEALTNVHKHAAGAAARVRLAHREGEVAVQVLNDPPAGGAPVALPLPSGGNGLRGMRERVTALGGGFVSGPVEGGGFRVSAVIPDQRRRREAVAERPAAPRG